MSRAFFWFISLCVFFTFSLSLVIASGYSFGIALLFLASLFFTGFVLVKKLFTSSITTISATSTAAGHINNNQDKWLFYTFLVYGLGLLGFVYIDGFNVRAFDGPSRFILALPALFMLLHCRFKLSWLFYGVAIGAVLTFVLAYYERFYLGKARANGGIVAIMFGNIAMMLGVISFVAALWAYAAKRYFVATFMIIAVICGIGASFLSGSRGGWVALPLIAAFLLWHSRDLLGKKLTLSIAVLSLVALVAIALAPKLGVGMRIAQANNNIERYMQGDSYSSVGLRFDMWKGAWYLFKYAPILGAGEYGAMALKKEQAEQGLIHPAAAKFSHAHSEYFDALGLRGLVGFLLLMAVYLIPLRLFLQKMREYPDDWNIKAYAMAGALVPMSFMDFGLTQAMFSHNSGIMMYVFPIIYFWAAVRWAQKDKLRSDN
ncbi:O-antigen ligase family protein [Gammaproteobacteria bacterium AS21]